VQAPAPAQLVDNALATAGGHAQLLVAKTAGHLPLYLPPEDDLCTLA